MKCPKCKNADVVKHEQATDRKPLVKCPACGYQFIHVELGATRVIRDAVQKE